MKVPTLIVLTALLTTSVAYAQNTSLEANSNAAVRPSASTGLDVSTSSAVDSAVQPSVVPSATSRFEVQSDTRATRLSDLQVDRQASQNAAFEDRAANRAERIAAAEAKRAERKAALEAKQASLRAATEDRVAARYERREERRARFSARAQAQLEELGKRLLTQYQNAIDRRENVALKLETRLDKLAEMGADVSSARATLDEAYKLLEEASAHLIEGELIVQAVLEAEDSRAAWAEGRAEYDAARALLLEIKTRLQETHKLALEAEGELRADSASVENSAATNADLN